MRKQAKQIDLRNYYNKVVVVTYRDGDKEVVRIKEYAFAKRTGTIYVVFIVTEDGRERTYTKYGACIIGRTMSKDIIAVEEYTGEINNEQN